MKSKYIHAATLTFMLAATGCRLPALAPKPAAPSVTLAAAGAAHHPVVVASNATDTVRAAASELVEMLGQITGAEFILTNGNANAGIVVGTLVDFPGLMLQQTLVRGDIGDREAYLLRTREDGILLIGATEMAVENAVWDFLYRLGYRQFFPGKTWEVIPHQPELSIALDTVQRPDYFARRIWYGYGPWDYALEPYREWCERNRARSGFQLNTGHAYDGLIARNKAAFEAHPEYYGLVDGERKSSKICIGNPDLRKLICNYAVGVFDKNPDKDSISMDPSDGGGWCECEQCVALGSISDRALTLANAVAEAVNRSHDNKVVGMYAYNYHSPPPTIAAHPQVAISCATAFIKGGMKLDDIMEGWSQKGAMLGVREYYSVNTWSRNMPGRARGGNLDYLSRTIPEFHARGARFMSAESGDCWGPNGLGYYLASRMLWDTNAASRIDSLVEDFLTRAFGAAAEHMADFYEQIDGSTPSLVFDDQLGRMFRALKRARERVETPAVRARLRDLVLYARYVDLYDSYRNARGDARQQAFEAMIRHAYRMRRTMMVHTKALYRDVVNRDKAVSVPKGAEWSAPEETNPWKSSDPFTDAEIDAFIEEGMANHEPVQIDFDRVSYTDDFVPATPLKLEESSKGVVPAGRGMRTFYTWAEAAPSAVELQITGGLIPWYRDRGNVKVDLFKIGGESETGERETLVAHDESVPPDGETYTVSLPIEESGLYRITISDGNDKTLVSWEDGVPMTTVSTVDKPARLSSRWTLHFYVPKGTDVIGFYASGEGNLLDPAGKVAFSMAGKRASFYSVKVPEGQDGALWTFSHTAGSRRLMTVPPCLARSADELLLPREVLEADALQ